MTASPMESLPTEILQRICGYLDNVLNFTLTSKRCLAIGKAVLYSDIHIHYISSDRLHEDIQKWTLRLQSVKAFQHVRHLHLTMAPEADPWYFDELTEIEEDLRYRWQDYHDQREVAVGDDHDREWQPVASFISSLPGLEGLHYSCAPQIAPCILESVESQKGCKLFLNSFILQGLWQPQGEVVRLNDYEQKLVSSPSLHTIVSNKFWYLDKFGKANFLEEAALSLASGLAPNLKKVSLRLLEPCVGHVPQAIWMASAIPRTKWLGTELGSKLKTGRKGTLEYLELAGDELCSLRKLHRWAEVTDFSKLSTLKLHGRLEHGTLQWLATQASLSLFHMSTFEVNLPWDTEFGKDNDRKIHETERDVDLIILLKGLPHLRSLRLLGWCNFESIGQALEGHSTLLETLAVFVHSMTPDITTNQWNLTALKELAIDMRRSGGDAKEVRWYRWIGQNFPDLRRLILLVDCSQSALYDYDRSICDLDESIAHLWHEQGSGIICDVQSVMRNYAIDSILVESIFHTISSAKRPGAPYLERLEYQIRYADSLQYPIDFLAVCRIILSRHWVSTLDPRDAQRTKLVTKEKDVYSREDYRLGTEIGEQTMTIFHSLWPEQPGKDWRKIWHSFPLTTDENDFAADRSLWQFAGLMKDIYYDSDDISSPDSSL